MHLERRHDEFDQRWQLLFNTTRRTTVPKHEGRYRYGPRCCSAQRASAHALRTTWTEVWPTQPLKYRPLIGIRQGVGEEETPS